MPKPLERMTSPAELVAIARAAHRVGDTSLLESAKRLLRARFGIVIRFTTAPEQPEMEKERVG